MTEPKTAEDIVDSCFKYIPTHNREYTLKWIIEAMQAYADQQTAQLQEQLKERDKLISELVGRWEEIKSFESLIKKASNPEIVD